jgi:hypothetical protein
MIKRWPFLLLALLPAVALGTTMKELSLEVLSQSAELIVIGDCMGKSVHFNEGHTRIYTDWTIRVKQVIKGKSGTEVVIRQLGGEIGDIGMRMTGTARFLPLEEVLVFTGAELEGARMLIGLAQGKFRIVTDQKSGEKYAVRDTSELLLIQKGKSQERLATPIKLKELVGQIQASLPKENR